MVSKLWALIAFPLSQAYYFTLSGCTNTPYILTKTRKDSSQTNGSGMSKPMIRCTVAVLNDYKQQEINRPSSAVS